MAPRNDADCRHIEISIGGYSTGKSKLSCAAARGGTPVLRANLLEDAGDCDGEWAINRAATGAFVTATTKALSDLGDIQAAQIAEGFGGGGHECASGCSIDGPLSIAVARILEKIRP